MNIIGSVVCLLSLSQSNPPRKIMEKHQFPFLHPSIAEILGAQAAACDDSSPRCIGVQPDTLRINHTSDKDMVSLPVLVELAYASDKALFDNENDNLAAQFDVPLQGLLLLCEKSVMVATLLALNRLESSIRSATGHSTGKAPLLKTMLQQLVAANTTPILKTLLLPLDGLNLRNLLWHGFIADIPRRWFSLVVVLVYNLEVQQDETIIREGESVVELPNLRANASLKRLLSQEHNITDYSAIQAWLPPSHRSLFDLAVTMQQQQSPACAAALLGVLLEHGLRLDWCRSNDSPGDASARPHSYYVTLDGHGQRNQHDLLLHPYRSDNTRNALISSGTCGATTIALLTDLFASSCGGPNIRAALAHGVWDMYVEKELCRMVTKVDSEANSITKEGKDRLADIVQIVLVALKAIATDYKLAYRPQFSYTAITVRNIQLMISQLSHLEKLRSSLFGIPAATVPDAVLHLQVPTERLVKAASQLAFADDSRNDEWTSDDVFHEHESNVMLADCIASRALLSDIVDATGDYIVLLEEAMVDRTKDGLSSRQQKRAKRLCSMADATLSVYSFAAQVALLFLLQQQKSTDAIKAVERCRMCVSTFATFLPTNSDRAIKAAVEFTKGKAVKAVMVKLASLENETELSS